MSYQNQLKHLNAAAWDWIDAYPIRVRVYDDIAIMQFFGRWRVENPDGPQELQQKRTEVFRKVNGRWLLIAGHDNPVE